MQKCCDGGSATLDSTVGIIARYDDSLGEGKSRSHFELYRRYLGRLEAGNFNFNFNVSFPLCASRSCQIHAALVSFDYVSICWAKTKADYSLYSSIADDDIELKSLKSIVQKAVYWVGAESSWQPKHKPDWSLHMSPNQPNANFQSESLIWFSQINSSPFGIEIYLAKWMPGLIRPTTDRPVSLCAFLDETKAHWRVLNVFLFLCGFWFHLFSYLTRLRARWMLKSLEKLIFAIQTADLRPKINKHLTASSDNNREWREKWNFYL